VANASRTRILDNHVHSNQDRGIQLWPNADGSLVAGNVVDRNGEGISIGGQRRPGRDHSSDRNVIRGNLIINSNANYADPDGAGPIQGNAHGWNLEFIRNRAGRGNLVEGNCFFASHPDPYYNSNGGINLADTNGAPVSVRFGPNELLRDRPVLDGLSVKRSGCRDESLPAAAVTGDCTAVAMNQWTGTPAADDFPGTALRDHAAAAEGNDSVRGAESGDCLFGGPGDDLLAGDADRDRLAGEDGADTLVAREAAEADWRGDFVSCGPGEDTVFADITDALDPDCETPVYRDP
jgi:parallel beta-helix repeat protein